MEEKLEAAAPAINRLAARCGIETEYWNIWGEKQVVSRRTIVALLQAMGLAVESESDTVRVLAKTEEEPGKRLVDPVRVFAENTPAIRILLHVPIRSLDSTFEWTLIQENGRQHGGTFLPSQLEQKNPEARAHFVKCIFEPGPAPEPGYHWLEIRESHPSHDGPPRAGRLRLIVAPNLCHMPAGLAEKQRAWGPALQS